MRIIVPEIPPTNNQFMGNSHSFREYNRMKEYWHWLIRAGIKERPEQPYQKAVVTITYFFPDNRKRDPDNYSGKFILDPLVRRRLSRMIHLTTSCCIFKKAVLINRIRGQ